MCNHNIHFRALFTLNSEKQRVRNLSPSNFSIPTVVYIRYTSCDTNVQLNLTVDGKALRSSQYRVKTSRLFSLYLFVFPFQVYSLSF